MKFFLTLAAVVAVAVASPVQRGLVAPAPGGPTPVIDENLISIGPAVLETNPISVGPAIVDPISPIAIGPAINDQFTPIAVGPAIIDFPVPAVESTPLVQIIVNVNGQASAVAPSPADNAVVDEVYVPGPVNIVDHVIAPEEILEPIQVVEPIILEPGQVVEPIVIEPIQVVEPIIVEPVVVGTPIIPAPVVVLPDQLN